jgi:hypothetical protein
MGPKFIFRPHFYVSGGYGVKMAPKCGNGTLNYEVSAICDFPKCEFSAPLGRTVDELLTLLRGSMCGLTQSFLQLDRR